MKEVTPFHVVLVVVESWVDGDVGAAAVFVVWIRPVARFISNVRKECIEFFVFRRIFFGVLDLHVELTVVGGRASYDWKLEVQVIGSVDVLGDDVY